MAASNEVNLSDSKVCSFGLVFVVSVFWILYLAAVVIVVLSFFFFFWLGLVLLFLCPC